MNLNCLMDMIYFIVKYFCKIIRNITLFLGMFQRLDKMRKNAFASVCLFGEDNNSTISGIWVWRGHELAFTVSMNFLGMNMN